MADMSTTTGGGTNEQSDRDEDVRALLRDALPPVSYERQRDLWPQMLARIEKAPALARRVPWFDWVLAAAAVVCVVCVPKVIPFLLFHL
jgi:hypothetical protein